MIRLLSLSLCRRFLEYARNAAQAESGRLHFSDIVPVVGSNPTVAARAFYGASLSLWHLLPCVQFS